MIMETKIQNESEGVSNSVVFYSLDPMDCSRRLLYPWCSPGKIMEYTAISFCGESLAQLNPGLPKI